MKVTEILGFGSAKKKQTVLDGVSQILADAARNYSSYEEADEGNLSGEINFKEADSLITTAKDRPFKVYMDAALYIGKAIPEEKIKEIVDHVVDEITSQYSNFVIAAGDLVSLNAGEVIELNDNRSRLSVTTYHTSGSIVLGLMEH